MKVSSDGSILTSMRTMVRLERCFCGQSQGRRTESDAKAYRLQRVALAVTIESDKVILLRKLSLWNFLFHRHTCLL